MFENIYCSRTKVNSKPDQWHLETGREHTFSTYRLLSDTTPSFSSVDRPIHWNFLTAAVMPAKMTNMFQFTMYNVAKKYKYVDWR